MNLSVRHNYRSRSILGPLKPSQYPPKHRIKTTYYAFQLMINSKSKKSRYQSHIYRTNKSQLSDKISKWPINSITKSRLTPYDWRRLLSRSTKPIDTDGSRDQTWEFMSGVREENDLPRLLESGTPSFGQGWVLIVALNAVV